MAVRSSTET